MEILAIRLPKFLQPKFFLPVFLLPMVLSAGCQSSATKADRSADPVPADSVSSDPVSGRPGPASLETDDPAPSWVGKVWVSASDTDLPGKMRIFLADGTLVMDSCWETYRLAKWEAVSEGVVRWEEDSAEIQASLEIVDSEELRIRLTLREETVEERYRAASVPYVCPDMER